MKILLVCNSLEKEKIRQILIKENIVSLPNLFTVHDFENAQSFIDNKLYHYGCHIDLIIVTGSIKNDFGDTHLIDRLRYSTDSFSNKTFKLNAIPAIYYAKEIAFTDYHEYGYNVKVQINNADNHSHLFSSIKSVIKDFRNYLWDDLDLLRINFDDLQSNLIQPYDSFYNLKIKPNSYYWASRTKILSEEFIENPHYLNYDWLERKNSILEFNIDEYETILKTINKYNRKISEKAVLHNLFNKASWLLQTDVFKNPVYEAPLMKNNSEYDEPDYILPSSVPGIIPNNVTEVKLPTLEILHRRKRKPGFKTPFTDALIQLSDYRRLIKTKDGRKQLIEIVNNKGTFSYTLLASNDEEKYRDAKRFKELMEDHYNGLNVMTHQEKLDEAKLYYERLSSFN